jgi:phosphoribosylformylglycinamidine (FGAM) synthase-like amidotransferase family enzyme
VQFWPSKLKQKWMEQLSRNESLSYKCSIHRVGMEETSKIFLVTYLV